MNHSFLRVAVYCLLFFPLITRGQIASPEAALMARNLNIPVSLYSGVASVSVPLYSGVGLQYTTSGIKVREIASSAGLGWELMAAGMITQQVKGLNDFQSTFYNTSDKYTNINGINNGTFDGEKDVFYFSFPGGSGTFFMVGSGCIQFPVQDSNISYSSGVFTIQDGTGRILTFTNTGSSPYTWYLTRIHSIGKPVSDDITYSYLSPVYLNDTYTSYSKTVKPNDCGQTTFVDVGSESSKTEGGTDAVLYLSQIVVGSQYKINFSYSSRTDKANAKRINYTNMTDMSGTELMRYTFYTSYFNAGDSYYQNQKYTTANGPCTAEKCYRLRLDSILLKINGQSLRYRVFDYTNNKNSSGIDYYELPPTDSYYSDHWGYYNGGPAQGTTYTKYPQIPMNGDYGSPTYPGMSKSPGSYASANMLYKVVYPEGGYTKLSYQPHTTAGGVRIYQVMQYNESDVIIAGTTYTYSGEEVKSTPKYFTDIGNTTYYCSLSGLNQNIDQFRIYSHSIRSAFDNKGPSVGYDVVTETDIMGNGYVKHYFLNFSDRVESQPTKYLYRLHGSYGTQLNTLNPDQVPFISSNYEYYDRGFENKTEVYDATNTLLRKIETTLPVATSAYTQSNIAVEDPQVSSVTDVSVAEYQIISRPVLVTSVKTTEYENGNSFFTTKNYYYHLTYKTLVNHTEFIDAEGNNYKTEIKYPLDIVNDFMLAYGNFWGTNESNEITGIKGLYNNRAFQPLEIKNSLKRAGGSTFNYLSGSIQTFGYYSNSFYAPYKSYRLTIASPQSSVDGILPGASGKSIVIGSNFGLVGTVNSYDAFGNATSITGADGISITSTFDSNGDYLLSQGINTRQTTYEYFPLIGVKKVTDINGRSVNYEYDQMNRFRMTRDHDGNIILRKRYHYAIQDEGLASGIAVSGTRKPNFALTFTSNNQYSFYGKTTYMWSFGDGSNSVETTNESVNHTYTAIGDYEIRLTLVNPEYEPIQLVSSITITTDGSGGIE